MLSRRDLIATVQALAVVPKGATARVGPGEPAATRSVAALALAAYPHPKLGGAFYTGLAARYLTELDAPGRAALDAFAARLDADASGHWATAPVTARTRILATHAADPAYRGFLWRTAELAYRDPAVWKLIGFEGSSLEHGGYLERGFDDIDWLPKTPA